MTTGGVRPVAERGIYFDGTMGFLSIEYHSETKAGFQLSASCTVMMWFRAYDSNNTNGTLFAKHRGTVESLDEVITWQVNHASGALELKLNDMGYSCDIAPLTFATWHIAAFYLK